MSSQHDVVAHFNERFILSLSSCDDCLVLDDELNVLPVSRGKDIVAVDEEHMVIIDEVAAIAFPLFGISLDHTLSSLHLPSMVTKALDVHSPSNLFNNFVSHPSLHSRRRSRRTWPLAHQPKNPHTLPLPMARSLHEVKLNSPIHYSAGDKI